MYSCIKFALFTIIYLEIILKQGKELGMQHLAITECSNHKAFWRGLFLCAIGVTEMYSSRQAMKGSSMDFLMFHESKDAIAANFPIHQSAFIGLTSWPV